MENIKIIFAGSGSPGKTSFMNRWTRNIWNDRYYGSILYGFDFKIIEQNGKKYCIQIWDLPGQDKDFMVTKVFAKNSHACVIMSDATEINDKSK